MKVLIPQNITDPGKQYLIDHGYRFKVLTDSSEETLLIEVGDFDAILIRTAKVSKKVINAGTKLKVISRHGVGVDNIDLDAATERGIWVTNGPMSNYETVAEHTMAFILALGHRIVEMDEHIRTGNWEARNKFHLSDVGGKTLGLLGLGRVGLAVAKRAALGFGMNVIGYDAFVENTPDYVKRVSSPRDVFTADYVSLHIPATADTTNLIDKSYIELMKPDAFLINCARGEILNENDLYEALSTGRIKGAALDVFQTEPIPSDNPLLSLKNLILSPHNAANSSESFDKMGLHAAQGIHEVLSGNVPTWPVNKI